MKKIIYFFPVILLLFSCLSYSKHYVLQELDQIASINDVIIDDPTQNKVKPVIGKILEIEVIDGEQKFIYARIGSRNKGLKKGLKANIYNDLQMNEFVGKCKIIQMTPQITKFVILELNYRVNQQGIVLIEVDPRFYIK